LTVDSIEQVAFLHLSTDLFNLSGGGSSKFPFVFPGVGAMW
jgi:hypothetical protein